MSRASDFCFWTAGRLTPCWPCGRKTPSSGPCPPGLALTTQVGLKVQPRLEENQVVHPQPDQICGVATFSAAPSQLITLLGTVVFLCSVVLGIHSLWQKFTGSRPGGLHHGHPLQLLIGSMLMICLGIIGCYRQNL